MCANSFENFRESVANLCDFLRRIATNASHPIHPVRICLRPHTFIFVAVSVSGSRHCGGVGTLFLASHVPSRTLQAVAPRATRHAPIWGHPPPFHNGPWGFEDGSVLKTIVRFETVDVQRHAVVKTPPFQNAPAVSERLRFRRPAAFWKRRWLQTLTPFSGRCRIQNPSRIATSPWQLARPARRGPKAHPIAE